MPMFFNILYHKRKRHNSLNVLLQCSLHILCSTKYIISSLGKDKVGGCIKWPVGIFDWKPYLTRKQNLIGQYDLSISSD